LQNNSHAFSLLDDDHDNGVVLAETLQAMARERAPERTRG
jgi:hypothetical protein